MSDAQRLAAALNVLTRSSQFSYVKARAAARTDGNVDWIATKAANADFNPDVDGCESFVMRDGSRCDWVSGQRKYQAKAASAH